MRLLTSIAVFLSSTGAMAQSHFWDAIPAHASTTPPTEIADGYWNGVFNNITTEVQASTSPEIVFFGNSITLAWRDKGLATWNEKYAPLNAINMGNSGDITPVMIYRVLNGNLDFGGAHPKVAVILAGTNNFHVCCSAGGTVDHGTGTDKVTGQQAADGIRAIAQIFRRKLPGTRVLILGILPTDWQDGWKQTNPLLAGLQINPEEVQYMDLQSLFTDNEGNPSRSIMPDGIHPESDGYADMAGAMDSLVTAWLSADPVSPVKIMPLGGSITEGLTSASSYRRYLDGMLRRAGHLVDFVGSRTKHNNNLDEVDSYEFDVDHEGNWGRTTDWIADNIGGLARAQVPDIALLHLGTEDLLAGQGVLEDDAYDASLEIERTIDSLRAVNPQIKIVLAKIIPSTSTQITLPDVGINIMNTLISKMIPRKSTPASPILVADLYSRILASADLHDGIRPNQAGAISMAQGFFTVIDNHLNGVGCTDNAFLEFDPTAVTADASLCVTSLAAGLDKERLVNTHREAGTVTVFDILGTRLGLAQVTSGGAWQGGLLQGSSLKPGVYILKSNRGTVIRFATSF